MKGLINKHRGKLTSTSSNINCDGIFRTPASNKRECIGFQVRFDSKDQLSEFVWELQSKGYKINFQRELTNEEIEAREEARKAAHRLLKTTRTRGIFDHWNKI